MASFCYTPFLASLLSARLIANGALTDSRVMLVMSNTTADTEEDAQFIANITTLDEFNGANYARKALANEVVNTDTVNNRGEFDADDLTAGGTGWTALGAGSRNIVAIVHYSHVTNDSDSKLNFYDDSAPQLPFNGNGSDLGITWNAEGILQAARA
ncbi:MAG TPA: hypothetical protein VNI83_02115 [Vicinamibacterales bacterium]|nr:hypothetical protein [Vicinamibacterales bacterium]